MNKIILILIFISFPIILYSQIINTNNIDKFKQEEPDKNKVYTYEIGGQAGSTGGFGLAFRYWFNEVGIQVHFLPYMNLLQGDGELMFGFTFLKQISYFDWSKLFFYVMMGNFINYNNTYTNLTYNAHLSIGPGIEIFYSKNYGLNILIGLAYYYIISSYDISPILFLNIETSYFYRF